VRELRDHFLRKDIVSSEDFSGLCGLSIRAARTTIGKVLG
jgi:hypothetical protein